MDVWSGIFQRSDRSSIEKRTRLFGQWKLLGPLSCLLILGCGPGGPPLTSVEGLITLNGKPLESVDVVFDPQFQGGAAYGKTNSSGQFTLYHDSGRRGAQPGEYKVSVVKPGDPEAVKKLPPGSSSADMMAFLEPVIYLVGKHTRQKIGTESVTLTIDVLEPHEKSNQHEKASQITVR